MEKFASVDEALDFAIKGEEEANAYYVGLADRVEKPWMKDLFKKFAREELGHKAKLIGVKEGRVAPIIVGSSDDGPFTYPVALITPQSGLEGDNAACCDVDP